MSGVIKTLAVLVVGGPAPGINGVIDAATIEVRNHGLRAFGLYDGFRFRRLGAGHRSGTPRIRWGTPPEGAATRVLAPPP